MNPAAGSRAKTGNSVWLLLILGLPVVGYFGWEYYQAKNSVPPINYVKVLTDHLKRLGQVDKIADDFVDTNGDLVADGPKDPAQVIDPAELVFCPGVAVDAEAQSDWQEWIDVLAKKTGKPVKFQAVEDLETLVGGLAAGKIHVTSFNTGFVPTAVNRGGFIPAVSLADAAGKTSYVMEFIVPAASDVKTLADVKGKKVFLTSAGSHSGFKAPIILLRDEIKLQPGADYEFVMTGGHPGSIQSVGRGHAAVAAVAGDLLADAAAEGKLITKDKYRSIYQSKSFPKGAWGCSCKLKPELAAKIKDAFLSFDLKGTKLEAKFAGQKAVKFAPVDYQKDWAYVREIDEKMVKW